jgi:hypothetical protein
MIIAYRVMDLHFRRRSSARTAFVPDSSTSGHAYAASPMWVRQLRFLPASTSPNPQAVHASTPKSDIITYTTIFPCPSALFPSPHNPMNGSKTVLVSVDSRMRSKRLRIRAVPLHLCRPSPRSLAEAHRSRQ